MTYTIVIAAFPQDAAKIVQLANETNEVVQEWICWEPEIAPKVEEISKHVEFQKVIFFGPRVYTQKIAENVQQILPETEIEIQGDN